MHTSMNRPVENIVCPALSLIFGVGGSGLLTDPEARLLPASPGSLAASPPRALGYRLEPQPALCLHGF